MNLCDGGAIHDQALAGSAAASMQAKFLETSGVTRRRILPKPQTLHQKFDRDAHLGKVSVVEWQRWFEAKGFVITRRDGCSDDAAPCAHLGVTSIENPETRLELLTTLQ